MLVSEENTLLGIPRLMQVRVKNSSCTIPYLFKKHFRDCYNYFEEKEENKSSYGFQNRTGWHFESHSNSSKYGDVDYIVGFFGNYPTNSFVQELTMNDDNNRLIIHELIQGEWIDRATRAVIIEFSTYNPNLDMLCFTQ